MCHTLLLAKSKHDGMHFDFADQPELNPEEGRVMNLSKVQFGKANLYGIRNMPRNMHE